MFFGNSNKKSVLGLKEPSFTAQTRAGAVLHPAAVEGQERAAAFPSVGGWQGHFMGCSELQ